MKRILKLLLLLIVLLNQNISAQTFAKTFGTIKDERADGVIEIDNNYLLIVNSGDYLFGGGQNNLQSSIYKMNNFGVINDSLIFDTNSFIDYNVELYEFVKINNSTFVIGIATHKTTNDIQTYLGKISNTVNLLWDTIIGSTSLSQQPVYFYLDNNNDILINSIIYSSKTFYVEKIDTSGNFLCSNNFQVNVNVPGKIIELENCNCYHFELGSGFIFKMDKQTLQFTDTLFVDSIYHWISGHDFLKKINDSMYFETGFYLEQIANTKWDMAYNIRNENAQIVDTMVLGKPDTTDLPGFQAIDFTTTDSVFYGGTSNFDIVSGDILENQDRWFLIYNFNINGQINWSTSIGGDANYIFQNLKATSDGGCIAVGTRYDWRNSSIKQRDVFIVKLDASGNVSFVNHNQKTISISIIVSPNPSAGVVRINQTGIKNDFKLSVTNLQGQEIVPHKTISHNQNNIQIDLSKYPKGIYLIKLANKDFLKTQKIILE